VATGLVYPDGSVSFTQGPVPTVTHLGPGTYEIRITIGTGCPLPSLTPYGASFSPYYLGGPCGGGLIDTTVYTGNGQDEYWSYLFIGTSGAGASAPTKVREQNLPTG